MDTGQGATLSLYVLLLYFAVVVCLGVFYSRRTKSTEDLILAGHSLSTPFVTGSVVATWLGVFGMVGLMVWSLERQKRCLATELVGEVPENVYRDLTGRGYTSRALWRALRQEGLPGLRRARVLHQQCAELAFKKMQRRERPHEPGLAEEINRLRAELRTMLREA